MEGRVLAWGVNEEPTFALCVSTERLVPSLFSDRLGSQWLDFSMLDTVQDFRRGVAGEEAWLPHRVARRDTGIGILYSSSHHCNCLHRNDACFLFTKGTCTLGL